MIDQPTAASLDARVTFQGVLHRAAGPACALCRVLVDHDSSIMWDLATDEIMYPDIQHELTSSHGLCGRHMLLTPASEGARYVWSHLGTAEVCRVVLAAQIRRLASSVSGSRLQVFGRRVLNASHILGHGHFPFADCRLCQKYWLFETHYIDACLAQVDRFVAANPVLCIPHLNALSRRSSDPSLLASLRRPFAGQLDRFGRARSPLIGDLLFGRAVGLWQPFVSEVALPFEPACASCRTEKTMSTDALLDALTGVNGFALCFSHAWQLSRAVAGDPALVVRLSELASKALDQMESGSTLVLEGQCAACSAHACDKPAITGDLCFPHLRRAVAESLRQGNIDPAARRFLERAHAILQTLDDFAIKCSEQYQHLLLPKEERAWLEAIQLLIGPEAAPLTLTTTAREAPACG